MTKLAAKTVTVSRMLEFPPELILFISKFS